ncbi:hypothetical protein EU545_02845 [Candidatus Thorarchaeota archaeon]|nr:MAG: hypothetical protein EU545_02845 [Candidatus Thorarchaeota archaeon]
MIGCNDLMKEYVGAAHRLKPKQEALQEAIEVIYQNDWLRMVVATDPSLSDRLFLAVEICIPNVGTTNRTRRDDTSQTLSVLRGMIEHLEYLCRLSTAGFNLQIIREDCLWTATRFLPISPEVDDFRVLVPPECVLG